MSEIKQLQEENKKLKEDIKAQKATISELRAELKEAKNPTIKDVVTETQLKVLKDHKIKFDDEQTIFEISAKQPMFKGVYFGTAKDGDNVYHKFLEDSSSKFYYLENTKELITKIAANASNKNRITIQFTGKKNQVGQPLYSIN